MNQIKKVEGFQTTDGEFHLDEAQAEDAQLAIDQQKYVEEWVNSHCYHGMDKCDIIDAILEHLPDLSAALAGSGPVSDFDDNLLEPHDNPDLEAADAMREVGDALGDAIDETEVSEQIGRVAEPAPSVFRHVLDSDLNDDGVPF